MDLLFCFVFFLERKSLGGAGTIWQPLTWCYSLSVHSFSQLLAGQLRVVCLRVVCVCVQCVCLCLCMCVCVMWSVCTRERGRVCPEPTAVVAKGGGGALPHCLFFGLGEPSKATWGPCVDP